MTETRYSYGSTPSTPASPVLTHPGVAIAPSVEDIRRVRASRAAARNMARAVERDRAILARLIVQQVEA